MDSRLSGFKSLSIKKRLSAIAERAHLNAQEKALLADAGALPKSVADGMIENVIGTFELPMGVAANFVINGRDRLIPMAVEEPSIIASASFMAKLARECGGFHASTSGSLMRAQIQVLDVPDVHGARLALLSRREEIIAHANTRDAMLVSLGGGCRELEVHVIETPGHGNGTMLVAHLIVDVRDAMGANAVNTMAEACAGMVEAITGGRVLLRILSNLADLRLARAHVTLSPAVLSTEAYSGERVIEGIIEAATLAVFDPYRAATHNKGIMNAIDPVVLATGNDWRAVEAGAHAWAARGGRYTALTRWEKNRAGHLVGSIEMPLAVGLVGGATRTHPLAKIALKIMEVTRASELAEIIVTAGLAQNLAALRALSTEGIQRGHMALHARNLALAAGAEGAEVDAVARAMAAEKDVRADRAKTLLEGLRQQPRK